MTDLLSALREFRVLEERRSRAALAGADLSRWSELRTQLGPRARLLAPPPEAPLIDAGELEEVAPPPLPSAPPTAQILTVPAGTPGSIAPAPPIPIAAHPSLASRFPSLMALESEVTDPAMGGGFAEAAEPPHREKTQPGFTVADLPQAPAAREITAQVNLSEMEKPPEASTPPGEPQAPVPEQPIFAALLAEAGVGAPTAAPAPAAFVPTQAPSVSIPTERIKLPLGPVESEARPASAPEPVEPPPAWLAPPAAAPTPTPLSDELTPPMQMQPDGESVELPLPTPLPPSPLPLNQQLDALAWGALPSVPSFVATPPPPTPIALGSPVAPVAGTPVTPLALGSPVAPAVSEDFDAPVTPVDFNPPAAPLALGTPQTPLVELPFGSAEAPEPQAAPPAFGASVLPIALGSPLAPATGGGPDAGDAGIPPETKPYAVTPLQLVPAPQPMPLQLVPADEPAPPAPLQLVPTPQPIQLIPDAPSATPDWLASDPVPTAAEHRPPPPTPILLEQPTVVLGPEAEEPRPEPQKLIVEAPTAPGSLAQPARGLPASRTLMWDVETTEDDADLPMVVPDEVLPPEPKQPSRPPAEPRRASAPPPEPRRASAPPAEPRRASAPPPEPRRASVPPPATPAERAAHFAAQLGTPQVVLGDHRVVVHTLAGPLKRGTLREPDLEADHIDLLLPNGSVEQIAVKLIKAIFFMMAPGQQSPPQEGSRITVSFEDGRQLAGFCSDVRSSAPGFFILPADSRTNTSRIYIFRAAVKDIAES